MQADFLRSLEHWKAGVTRLADLDYIASPQAWRSLEHYLGVSLRQALNATVNRVQGAIQQFERELQSSTTPRDPAYWQQKLVIVRQLYLRAETTVDFYADCLASRSIPRLAALLRACDHIATRAMAEGLVPMGRQVPAALTYWDKGIGASVIKAGLRLWDGTIENPVATIKVTRHNIVRCSAIVHEAGHQVMHMLGWVPELADALKTRIDDATVGALWSAWASEIAADAYAHVHTGYGAAAALHDVLDGADSAVFSIIPGDPHPASYVRVLMVLEMCRHTYGDGPWDGMATSWMQKHKLSAAPRHDRALFEESVRLMPQIAHVVLSTPYRAFGNRPLTALVDPQRVSPLSLEQLSRDAGNSAFTSTFWTWNEAIRLLALTSYRAAESPARLGESIRAQEAWMLRLGAQRAAA
jgi:hypothetical protein